MRPRRRRGLASGWLVLADAGGVVLAYLLAFVLRFHGVAVYPGHHASNFRSLVRALPLVVGITLALAQVYGLYQRYPLTWPEQVQSLFLLVSLGAVLAMAASFFARAFAVPRSVIALAAVLDFLLMYGYRRMVFLRWMAREGPPRLLFVHAGGAAPPPMPQPESGAFHVVASLGLGLSSAPAAAEPCLGVPAGAEGPSVPCPPRGAPSAWDAAATGMRMVRQAVAECGGDGLLLDAGLPGAVKEELALLAVEQGLELFLVPRLLDLLVLQSRPALFGDRLVVNLAPGAAAGYQRALKRGIDVCLSAFFLVLTAPIVLAAALAVLLEDGPPVLYRQERLGLRGRRFVVLKLRTMRRDAEAVTGPVLASADDPRVTRVGRWLRHLHVDELPQLWNVLRGEMSLVGPRPERPAIHAEVAATLPAFAARLQVLPGLTGLAQVHGSYDTHPHEKLKYDVLYSLRASAGMDVQILLRTARNVLRGLGRASARRPRGRP